MKWILSKWRYLLLGVILVSAYALYIASSSPGREEVIDETERIDPLPTPDGPLDSLHTSWDSEATADWPVAELLAEISEQAYRSPIDAETVYMEMGFERVKTFVDSSMVGYVISIGSVHVIAFRGTDDSPDWIVNLDTRSTNTSHGPIHQGFHQAYLPLKDQIRKIIGEQKPSHLWITGHSLGGALALICAYDLVENEQVEIDGLITFGQPIVAKQQLATYLDKLLLGRYAHIVNASDLVPRIPPTFTHCGSLVWFTDGGIKRSKPKRLIVGDSPNMDEESQETEDLEPISKEEFEEIKADMRAAETEPEHLPDGRPVMKGDLPWLRDHSMALYLEKIRSIRGSDSQR